MNQRKLKAPVYVTAGAVPAIPAIYSSSLDCLTQVICRAEMGLSGPFVLLYCCIFVCSVHKKCIYGTYCWVCNVWAKSSFTDYPSTKIHLLIGRALLFWCRPIHFRSNTCKTGSDIVCYGVVFFYIIFDENIYWQTNIMSDSFYNFIGGGKKGGGNENT